MAHSIVRLSDHRHLGAHESRAVAQELRSTDIIKRALQAKPDVVAGNRLYSEQCVTCHGPKAHGNPDEVIPSLAGQLPIYVIKQLVDLAEGERESADMPRRASRSSAL